MLRFLLGRSRTVRVPRENGSFTLQKVSITQTSKFPTARFVTGIFVGIALLHTIRTILPSPASNRDLEKIKKQLEDARRQSDNLQPSDRPKQIRENPQQPGQTPRPNEVTEDDLGDCVHLMLPIWVRRRPQQLYLESDPEWKAYVRFAKDKNKVQTVKMKIAQLVQREAFQKHSPLIKLLEVKAMNILIDFLYPIGPPASYEVPCLYLPRDAPQNAAYGWRQLPETVGSRMDRVFHPVIMSKAFYAGCQEFARVTYLLCRARILDQIAEYRARSSGSGNNNQDTTSAANQSRHTEEMKAIESLQCTKIPDARMKEILPFLRGEFGENESRQKFRDVVKTMTFKSAIESATAVFRTHWSLGQMRALQRASRDTINIRGRIDFEGQKGKLRCIVAACYDIEADALIGRPVLEKVYLVPDAERWSLVTKDDKPRKTVPVKPTQPRSPTPNTSPSPSPPQAEGQARKQPPSISTENEREE
ncbi:hypothetical protein PV10_03134 [Exophiala mesophila]|uniref:Uncharacterized protein n=2 Tax=Exophiala mesophila TaxID=212818 RepID=A0A0D1Y497_EXOME|nr:uncharacterized protein PV10_03134 [Exophiala mesophila]KIV95481.1 hypothetical protein PV10_03134 [Exophiala mesophila]